MTKLPIPASALSQHIAILGKTGSGKSATARLLVEHVVAGGARVCVLDTIKSDWWGITSSASGREPGLPFRILGGPHGHVPLHSASGEAIGELVGAGKLPLSIVDMADFEPGGIQRFFIDFAASLWKHVHGVVYLVIEEAHEVAPKEIAGFGKESMSIHWAKKIATGARSKGIRLMVATQSVQQLHNRVLGSCETLIAHRLTTPADQDPVIKWLKANVGLAQAREVGEGLASQPAGTAWVCSGEAKFFGRIAFPKFWTYDNTATPTDNDQKSAVITAPVDQEQLRAIIGEAVAQAEANDPKALKGKVAKLEAALLTAQQKVVADPETERRAYNRGYKAGGEAGYNQGFEAAHEQIPIWFRRGFEAAHEKIKASISGCLSGLTTAEAIAAELQTWDQLGARTPIHDSRAGFVPQEGQNEAYRPPAPAPRPYPADPIQPAARPISGPLNGTLKRSLQNVLDAIAFWRKIGIDPVERAKAAVVAGLSLRASTFGIYIAELLKMGLVFTETGKVGLTPEGRKLANMPTAATAKELYAMGASLLKPQEIKVFDVVHRAYPKPIRRDEIAAKLGLSPKASTTGVYIAGVAQYGLIETAGPGAVKAADWLFP